LIKNPYKGRSFRHFKHEISSFFSFFGDSFGMPDLYSQSGPGS
jgi:hypothetical protein